MRRNDPNRWHFTIQTNANGYAYIYAYQTAWDPLTKRSRRVKKMYVGRLHEDDRVDICAKFAEAFPVYANGEFYYGANKTLVTKAEYLIDFSETPGPAAEMQGEPDDAPRTGSLGAVWAAEQIAQQSGLLEDLKACFGAERALDLFHLALYKLNAGNAMAGYNDWRQQVVLPNARPLTGQRISEILGSVTQDDFDKFFRRRHDRKVAAIKDSGSRLNYAFDNTSISTYSRTIDDAAYGHAKRDPELRQINYTFVCDQSTGDVVFVHTYEGSINDVTALQEILYRMKNAELCLDDVALVTDRGYSSIHNVQKMLNLELQFVQGVRIVEDVVKKHLDNFRESLYSLSFYNASVDAYARTVVEPWTEDREFGRLTQNVYLHLYRFPGVDEAEKISLAKKVEELVHLKNENMPVPPALWQTHGRYLREVRKDGRRTWLRDDRAIEEACRYAGMFVLRSNVISDPFEALKIYGLRNTVEMDFNQFKNWLDGDRLRCTGTAYLGKLFITTLATSLRLMMLNRVRSNRGQDLPVPYDSLDGVLVKLRGLQADKRPKARSWISRTLTKKHREMFTLLGVPFPPRVLR